MRGALSEKYRQRAANCLENCHAKEGPHEWRRLHEELLLLAKLQDTLDAMAIRLDLEMRQEATREGPGNFALSGPIRKDDERGALEAFCIRVPTNIE
jgi:hypothetical protein